MRLKYFCPKWGSESTWPDFILKVKNSGYDGIEASFPLGDPSAVEIAKRISDHGLELVAQHWQTKTSDFALHKEQYFAYLSFLLELGPVRINSQTGRDYFSFNQNKELISIAEGLSTNSGVPICHETHRGSFAFAAHVTHQFLNDAPIPLALDLSHWCCVAETLLDDQPEALEAAFMCAEHVHARVGFIQGPQIMDPSAPENEATLEKFISWWARVLQIRKEKQTEFIFVPEFGPKPYMQTLPFTGVPIYDQWNTNLFMLKTLKTRFGNDAK